MFKYVSILDEDRVSDLMTVCGSLVSNDPRVLCRISERKFSLTLVVVLYESFEIPGVPVSHRLS